MRWQKLLLMATWLALLPGLVGCPAVSQYRPRAEVQHRAEPVTNRPYRLYVPSGYAASRSWPLVVTCHGTRPWDSASLQMREWAGLAEKTGFLVVAPDLVGTRGDVTPGTERQIRLQQADERAILGAVNHVKAGYNVAEAQVFLTGWSGGAFAALWTGLRHPEVFRALAIRQGTFEAAFLAGVSDRLDRNQPIFVCYGQLDPVRVLSHACIDWLEQRKMAVIVDERPGLHRRMPEVAWHFFCRVAEDCPWFVVQWQPGWQGDPLAVRFSVKADPAVNPVEWQFGDGQEGLGTPVVHRYQAGGQYTVHARGRPTRQGEVSRRLTVTVAPGSLTE